MSYILDALIKADCERQREAGQGAVPGLHTVQAHLLLPPSASPAGARTRLAAAVGLAALAAAARASNASRFTCPTCAEKR